MPWTRPIDFRHDLPKDYKAGTKKTIRKSPIAVDDGGQVTPVEDLNSSSGNVDKTVLAE